MSGAEGPGPKAGIPSWQKAFAMSHEASPQPDAQHEQRAQSGGPPSTMSADLVKQGSIFLQDESVQSASLDQKKAFLRSKGLSTADIDEAIALNRRSHTPESIASSSTGPTSSPSSPEGQSTTSMISPDAPRQAVSRDIPPIITYPEFLLQSRHPPPIITGERLLNTAYVASAVGAAAYVASKYLVAPMMAIMTEARHDFAAHTQSRLDDLNSKLSSVVSSEPKGVTQPTSEDVDDNASNDSDPTELFHRDFGTQTTPSAVVDDKASDASDDADSAPKRDAATEHTSKLEELTAHCTAVTNDDMVVSSEDQETLTVMRVLHEYLESMAFPVYSTVGQYGGSGNLSGFGTSKDGKDDELSRFKAEIRSVKGRLLSARNFPASKRAAGLPPTIAN